MRGYDDGKKVKGRKRHLRVDTEHLVLADLPATFPRLRHPWVGAGFRGRIVRWVEATLEWSVEIGQHWWTGARGVWVAPSAKPPENSADFQV